jgi:hypothetical protein
MARSLSGLEDRWNWTWGCHFSDEGKLGISGCIDEQPFHGGYPNLFSIEPMTSDWSKRDLWNEIKRRWRVAMQDDPLVASIPAEPGLVMRHERPRDPALALGLIHHGVDFRRGGIEGARLEYFLRTRSDEITPLPQASWADWDPEGGF